MMAGCHIVLGCFRKRSERLLHSEWNKDLLTAYVAIAIGANRLLKLYRTQAPLPRFKPVCILIEALCLGCLEVSWQAI